MLFNEYFATHANVQKFNIYKKIGEGKWQEQPGREYCALWCQTLGLGYGGIVMTHPRMGKSLYFNIQIMM